MTGLVALGPLALTPVVGWLLVEFGPERAIVFVLWWLIPSLVFAIAMPLHRRAGYSLGRASLRAIVWSVPVTLVVFVLLLFGFTPRVRAEPVPSPSQRSDTSVRIPAAGSATRTAILGAVRAHVGVKSRFKVTHVRATDRWAFVRCTEVVDDGTQLQETDLDVAALLERRGARWAVVDLWSLGANDERPCAPFARRVRQRVKDARLPTALFPAGFLTSDVPG